jgi:carbonic anhydrase
MRGFAFVDRVARANVVHSMQTLRRISPLLAKMEAEGKITIVGGLYDLNTEAVTFLP